MDGNWRNLVVGVLPEDLVDVVNGEVGICG